MPGRALDDSAESYRAIFDTIADGIIVTDHRGRIRSFNHAAEALFGYSAEECIGRHLDMLMSTPVDSRRDALALRWDGKSLSAGLRHEIAGRRKDQALLQLDLSIVEWQTDEGDRRITLLFRDATAVAEHSKRLRKAKEAADRDSQAKTDFLAVMSHEMRTPLTSISGFTELLAQTSGLTRKQKRYVELIRSASAAMLNVVNDVLDFSKVEAGELRLENQPFRVENLVENALSIIRDDATKKDIDLTFRLAPEAAGWRLGDDNRLRQILLNLLTNAVKFTDRGKIEVDLQSDGADDLRFVVADTGIGIPLDQQPKLFKRFSQMEHPDGRIRGGAGLGLAICKRLVELMKGEIGVVSHPGVGSTFWVTLHLPRTEEPAPIAAPSPQIAKNAPQARVLLVDDIDTNREIVSVYLENGGIEVDTAGSGQDAIERVQQTRYDAVLMDIQMPVMDGIAATRRIRSLDHAASRVPIIAMTGDVLPQQISMFKQAGMNDHIAKPIDRAELYSTVSRWIAPPANDSREVCLNFNRTEYNELLGLIGTARMQRTLTQFHTMLEESFCGDEATARREAHNLVNGAGIFGFQSLLGLCRKMAKPEPEDDDAVRGTLLQNCQLMRDAVCAFVASNLLPELAAANELRQAV